MKPGDVVNIALIQNVTINDHRAIHIDSVARELVKRGHSIDVVLQKTTEEPQFSDIPYNLIELPGETYSVRGQIQFVVSSLRLLKGHDIIHAKNPFSSVAAPAVLHTLRIIKSKVIYDMRGLWVDFGVYSGLFSPGLGKVLNVIDTTLMQLCDHVIAISPELNRILSQRIPPEKITTITGSGVNIQEIEHITPESVHSLGIDGVIIGYVGTVSAARHSDRLIEAFHHVRKQFKPCSLVLVGPEDGSVRELINHSEHVYHIGFVPHRKALALLKSFDVAVAYHDVENPIFDVAVPIKILEYMAAGIPVVATDHPMYRNVLAHKKTGYLTSQTPESFAEGILTVLEDSNLQRYMAEQTKQEVRKYSLESLVDQLELLYNTLVD